MLQFEFNFEWAISEFAREIDARLHQSLFLAWIGYVVF